MLHLADRASTHGWHIVALDASVDTTTPTGRFGLLVLAGVAELERDQAAERTRAALAQLRSRGVRLGAPVSDATRRAGRRAIELRTESLSWRHVASTLTAEGYPTRGGGQWWPSSAHRAARTVTLDDEAGALRAAAASPPQSAERPLGGHHAPPPPMSASEARFAALAALQDAAAGGGEDAIATARAACEAIGCSPAAITAAQHSSTDRLIPPNGGDDPLSGL